MIRTGPALAPEVFAEIRRTMELFHHKWDAQVGDTTALASFPLLLDRATWKALAEQSLELAREILAAEEELLRRPELCAELGMPRVLRRVFERARDEAPTPSAARVMRFDFHPTPQGFRVSEVNSDVPGGFTEATHFTSLVAAHYPGTSPTGDPTRAVIDALVRVAGEGGKVALLSAPGYLEDHQVVAHLGTELRARGLEASCISPRQLCFRKGEAYIETEWAKGPVQAIVRFYQAEWLARLPRDISWAPLFMGGRTPVSNPGRAALGESKRLPLLWDTLATPMEAWRRSLPETRSPRDAPFLREEEWILKSAYSNTGDTVSIRPLMSRSAFARRAAEALVRGNEWIAQRRFETIALETPRGLVYPCIGVYVVDGEPAGAYGRIAPHPVIDFAATDIAILIDEEMT